MAAVTLEINGQKMVYSLDKDLITIGRVAGNDLVIADASISRKHAQLAREGNNFFLEDLGSANGTFINDKKISKRQRIKNKDILKVGTVSLFFQEEGAQDREAEHTKAFEEKATPSKNQQTPPKKKRAADEPVVKLKINIHHQLLERMNLKRLDLSKSDDEELRQKTKTAIEAIISELKTEELHGLDKNVLAREVLDEALGLGPLETLLNDSEVTEIMVNDRDHIYIENKGKLRLSGKHFVSDEQILQVIDRIVAPIGRRIDESMPMVDARLKDGSRVNAIIPPLALKGPSLTIRKFSDKPFGVQDLIRFGSITQAMADFLAICVKIRKNIVVSGGTGSGKTTLLNLMSSFIPEDERIITIEDAAELRLPQEHVVSLESRPPNIEGKGAITIRDLVRNALRMRPDRIVVGECRGGEALDMLQAMNTGHDGSLTTAHANSARDVLARLETMVLMSGMDLPVRAIREQIGSAVNMIVQISRQSDGSRKIISITEVTGMEGDVITLQDIFVFKQSEIGTGGKVIGTFKATGFVPTFIEEVKVKGIQIDMRMFQE